MSVASEPGTALSTGDAAVSKRACSRRDPEGTEASCLQEAGPTSPGDAWAGTGRVPTAESGHRK